MFHCKNYSLNIPLISQRGFCAKRKRKAVLGDYCLECEHGIKAEREERAMPMIDKECEKHGKYTAGPTGTCPKCKEEKGITPGKKAAKPKPRAAAPARATECQGCAEMETVLAIFVASKLIRADQVDKAREMARAFR